jgi:hypothetical protein
LRGITRVFERDDNSQSDFPNGWYSITLSRAPYRLRAGRAAYS